MFSKLRQNCTNYLRLEITITGIPQRAYDYVVNEKSAIGWIMERYQITTDKNQE